MNLKRCKTIKSIKEGLYLETLPYLEWKQVSRVFRVEDGRLYIGDRDCRDADLLADVDLDIVTLYKLPIK